jgi:shikimate kinase
MDGTRSNVVLIGMPGSGKSTAGVLLAKLAGRAFIDTDLLIQSKTGAALQDIVDRKGYLELRRIEEQVLLDLDCRETVIATGGSAVYSPAAMRHLRAHGVVIFLQVDLQTLKTRVRDYDTRGLAKRPDQTIDDLFAERCILYRSAADITIDCARLGHEEVCARIMEAMRSFPRAT